MYSNVPFLQNGSKVVMRSTAKQAQKTVKGAQKTVQGKAQTVQGQANKTLKGAAKSLPGGGARKTIRCNKHLGPVFNARL